MTHGVEWIITDFITERLVVSVGFFFPCGGMGVTTGENMLMAELKEEKLENMEGNLLAKRQIVHVMEAIVINTDSGSSSTHASES